MPILEIITIGTELLLGEITDTNSTYIARTLRDHGIDIYRITTIGDNPGRIASTIKEAQNRADIIITTGGLGPTVDDPTREAVANAIDRDLIFNPELWEQIVTRFENYGRKPTANNRRQAFIPMDAIPIKNPIGTAPCFIVEIGNSCIISLPGVPREMEFILHKAVIPYLKEKFALKSQIIQATVLHAASIGESAIDEIIADLERKSNPTVGLLAHPGQVDIRVTAKANSKLEAFALQQPVIEEIKFRLGEHLFGQDQETLEGIVCQLLNQRQIRLQLIEHGFDQSFINRLKLGQPYHLDKEIIEEKVKNEAEFINQVKNFCQNDANAVCFGIALTINEQRRLHIVYMDKDRVLSKTRIYGGPTEYAQLWAQNVGLDFLRRQLQKYW